MGRFSSLSTAPAERCSNPSTDACGWVLVTHRTSSTLIAYSPCGYSLTDTPPTSTIVKTQQKISGRLTSNDVTHDRLDIRSYIHTIRKHGAGVMAGIRAALAGNPWRPPALAPT